MLGIDVWEILFELSPTSLAVPTSYFLRPESLRNDREKEKRLSTL